MSILILLSYVCFIISYIHITITKSSHPPTNPYYKSEGSTATRLTSITKMHTFLGLKNQINKPLLTKQKISNQFTAETNNLGIIAIPFFTNNRSIKDQIMFRLKQSDQPNWYYEEQYSTAQFQTNVPFPFGFPPIADSDDKSYIFEIESLTGSNSNAISISTEVPYFITEYKFTREVLAKSPLQVGTFGIAKANEELDILSQDQLEVLIFALLAPFVLYGLSLIVNRWPKQVIIFLSGLLLIIIIHLGLLALVELGYPYPREYRDGASLDLAHQFAQGSNPYTIQNALPHTYLYGVLPLLFNAFISKIFFIDHALAQHLISFVAMLIITYLVTKEVYQSTKSIPLTLMSTIIALLYNNVTFRQEILGVLLTTITLYFINHKKELNFKDILLLSLSLIVLYYNKQYFLILFPVLCVYFIFNQSKKNIIYLLGITATLGILSLIIADKLFPVYFLETQVNFTNMRFGNWEWMLLQSKVFIQSNLVLLSVFIITTIVGLSRTMIINFNITKISKPLLQISAETPLSNIYFIYAFLSILFLTFLLGQNGGAYMSYYYQLLPVAMTIFSLSYIHYLIQQHIWRQRILSLVLSLFLIGNLSYLRIPDLDTNKERQTWQNAIDYINQKDPQSTYLSPHFTIEAIKRGWPIHDNGQTEYFRDNDLSPDYKYYELLAPLVPQSKYVAPRQAEWEKQISQKMENRQFSLIVMTSGWNKINPLIDETYLNNYYTLKKTMKLPHPYLENIEFWEPK